MVTQFDRWLRGLGRRTVESCPPAERPLWHARSLYAAGYLHWVRLRSSLRYEAPIDPFRVVRIPPSAVELTAEEFKGLPKYRRAGRVVGGDWDRDTDRFRERTIFRSFRAHFEDGVPWPETEFFAETVARIEDGETWWDCGSREAFERRCAELDALYESIARVGVRSQAELASTEGEEPVRKDRPNALARRIEDEIAVHVGRDGTFLFCDGRNRLSMAKLLDVDSIPVRIMVRHEKWQTFRDDVAAGRVAPGDRAGHPDVRQLLD